MPSLLCSAPNSSSRGEETDSLLAGEWQISERACGTRALLWPVLENITCYIGSLPGSLRMVSSALRSTHLGAHCGGIMGGSKPPLTERPARCPPPLHGTRSGYHCPAPQRTGDLVAPSLNCSVVSSLLHSGPPGPLVQWRQWASWEAPQDQTPWVPPLTSKRSV